MSSGLVKACTAAELQRFRLKGSGAVRVYAPRRKRGDRVELTLRIDDQKLCLDAVIGRAPDPMGFCYVVFSVSSNDALSKSSSPVSRPLPFGEPRASHDDRATRESPSFQKLKQTHESYGGTTAVPTNQPIYKLIQVVANGMATNVDIAALDDALQVLTAQFPEVTVESLLDVPVGLSRSALDEVASRRLAELEGAARAQLQPLTLRMLERVHAHVRRVVADLDRWATPNTDVKPHYKLPIQQVNEALAERRFDRAVELAEQALAIDSRSATLRNLVARAKSERAIAELHRKRSLLK